MLRRKRGGYGFGTGRRGSFDGGLPDRFTGLDAGRYIAKYLRPDGAKRSFLPLLTAIGEITERDPVTKRLKSQVRPVYVSPVLTRATGVTMGFLRFRRRPSRGVGGVETSNAEPHLAYELRRKLGAIPIGPGSLTPLQLDRAHRQCPQTGCGSSSRQRRSRHGAAVRAARASSVDRTWMPAPAKPDRDERGGGAAAGRRPPPGRAGPRCLDARGTLGGHSDNASCPAWGWTREGDVSRAVVLTGSAPSADVARMRKRKHAGGAPYFRNWHRCWYGIVYVPASVTIQRGRVDCAVLGLPWLTVTHSNPTIVVFHPWLTLWEVFELTGAKGERIGVCAWKSSLLRYRLGEAGFALAEGPRRFGLWF